MGSSHGVLSSAKWIALCTIASRVTGLVRDVLLTRALGASWVQDAFTYGFQIPNLFRRLFGEGSMAPVFVPTFTRTIEREGRPAAWALLSRTNALLTVALLALLAVIEGIVALVWLLTTPADPQLTAARGLLLLLTALMAPFMVSICLLALWSSILNCLGSFIPAALAPLVLNGCMIAGTLWLGPALGATPRSIAIGVALSVLIAGALQLLYIVPALRRAAVPLGWRWQPRSPDVVHMLRLLPPVALSQGVLVFGVFLDANICTLLTRIEGGAASGSFLGIAFDYPLQEGALSVLTIAQRLYQFPLGVLAISVATAALPAFSRLAARQAWSDWTGEVRRVLRFAVFEGLLAGSMMIVLAEPIVRLLFEYDQFTADDTPRAARALAWYGVGLWAFCAQHIVTRAFYSVGDVRTPLAISCGFVPFNALIALILLWFEGIREAAFAISSSLTAAGSVVLGAALLQRRMHANAVLTATTPAAATDQIKTAPRQLRAETRVIDAATLIALAGMALCAVAAALADAWLRPCLILPIARQFESTLLSRSIDTFGSLALGSAVFLLVAYLLRLPEVRTLLRRRKPAPAASAGSAAGADRSISG